jgi:ketosteroid isomerase-like protein
MDGLIATILAVAGVAVIGAFVGYYLRRRPERQSLQAGQPSDTQAGQPSDTQTGQPSVRTSTESTPLAYRLVLYSILGVIIAFLVVMLTFAGFGIFTEGDAANAAAALSALFGIIGTLVGAYFGIKTSSSAQDILHDQATTTTQAATATTQAAFSAVGQSSAATEDLLSPIQGLHAAWNAGDEETILGFFTDNATVTVTPTTNAPPQTYVGKERIRTDFVQPYMHRFQVDSRNYRQDGNRMLWESTITAEKFRQEGINPVEGTAVATFEGGKIASLTFTFSPATQQRRQAAGNRTPS